MLRRRLTEYTSYGQSKAEILTEDRDDGGKNLYMKGIFLEGDVRNHNQRVYPTHEIKTAVETLNETIRGGESILGEADHPEELNINLDRVSHEITEMWMDGSRGCGKLKVLPTPMGNIVKTLLESGVKLGVSSRGSGNVDNNGMVSEFEIVTVDVVAKPSAPSAYPKAIYEALNMNKDGAIVEDLAIAMQHDPRAQKFLAEKLLKFIESIKV